MLRDHGLVQPPTVHILMEDMTPAYAAYVRSRPFHRGPDAATAIAELGLLPSVLQATHLAVTWEYADMHKALEAPGEVSDMALAVLEASLVGHTLRLHPFGLRADAWDRDRVTAVSVEWGPPARYPDAPLPEPIQRLLRAWRDWRPGDLNETVISLRRSGYGVEFIER